MKIQALFSSKDKSKELKCCLLQFLFGALRGKSMLACFKSVHLQATSLNVLQVSKWCCKHKVFATVNNKFKAIA